MKVELHINGKLNIILIPEDKIDHDVLSEMLASAEKGRVVSLISSEKDGAVCGIVGIEK